MTPITKLRKLLTENDVGLTGSHQAGFHVSKDVTSFFPFLDPKSNNPSVWLDVWADGDRLSWRYIHYNNKLTAGGTRDEFRITYVREWMKLAGASPGDIIELERLGERSYRAVLMRRRESVSEALRLDSTGRWSIFPLRR